jgi:hypothetical protein
MSAPAALTNSKGRRAAVGPHDTLQPTQLTSDDLAAIPRSLVRARLGTATA